MNIFLFGEFFIKIIRSENEIWDIDSTTPKNFGIFLSGSIGFLAAMPALADSEVEQLKRELSEQRQLIQRLLDRQESQEKKTEKSVESSAAEQSKARTLIPGVTFYGVADVNVSRTNSGFGQKTAIGSGGMPPSRLGVKGEREVAEDLKVIGLAEAGISLNTGVVGNGAVTSGINNSYPSSGGTLGSGSQIFSRQIYAGLSSSKYGSLTIGRQYAGSYNAAALGNAMGVGLLGYSGSLLPLVGGMPTRFNNSVVYLTPKFGGFSGHLTYSAGSENNINTNVAVGATTTTSAAGRGYDVAAFYAAGPIYAGVTTWNVLNASFATAGETGLAKKTGVQAFVSYDLKFVKLYATGVQGKISGGNYENVTKTMSKSSGWSVSASAPFGKHKIYASYTDLDDKSKLNKDAKLFGFGYSYDLYENTKLYAAWGKVDNDTNASYSLADGGDLVGVVSAPGISASGYMVGMNVSF